MNRLVFVARAPNTGLLLFFLVLTAFFCVASDKFFRASNLETILASYSFVAIIALGQTFPISVRGIDLSIGSIFALSGMVLFDCIIVFGLPGYLSIPIAILAGTLAGAINGIAVAYLKLQPFVATLATLATYRGLTVAISGRLLYPELGTQAIRDPMVLGLDEYYDILGATGLEDVFDMVGLGSPWLHLSVISLIVCAIAVHIILTRTTFGVALKAVGGNVEAARLAGIRTDRILIAAYALSGFFAAVAALHFVGQIGTATERMGELMELTAIAAAVIGGVRLQGGTATALGPIIGTFMLGVILIGLTKLGVSTYAQQVATGLILFAAIGYDRLRNRRRQSA